VSQEEATSLAARLREAVETTRGAAERTARVRRRIVVELERALLRMELGTPAARQVENALSAQLARVAAMASPPHVRLFRMGEERVLTAAEALADAVSGLAPVEVEVSAAAGEQLRKRLELRQSFRRLPDLGRAVEQSRSHFGRAFQGKTVAAVAGRLATSGRVLAKLTAARGVLKELTGQIEGLLTPLDRVRAELGFFTCRGRAVVVPSPGGRRREELELHVDPSGELMLVWDRYGASRLAVFPTRETTWRDGKTRWRRCFSLPRGEGDERRLRIERPALAAWTGEGRARLVRTGVLAWEEPTRAGARKQSLPEEG
jgi:hypothetical protein